LNQLGYAADALRTVDNRTLTENCLPAAALPGAATFAANSDKRQLATMAIDHLWAHSRAKPVHFPLPDSAPYGRIHVDEQRCTLCMGCTSVCPARAITAGDEYPRLVFLEVNCVQCGICANACPEAAISLEPRYLADPEKRRKASVLHEEPPFCCVQCGEPFATRRVIDNILEKLAGHAMFQTERSRRRLQMCEDCRVVDAVQDVEAMQGGMLVDKPPRHRNDS